MRNVNRHFRRGRSPGVKAAVVTGGSPNIIDAMAYGGGILPE